MTTDLLRQVDRYFIDHNMKQYVYLQIKGKMQRKATRNQESVRCHVNNHSSWFVLHNGGKTVGIGVQNDDIASL